MQKIVSKEEKEKKSRRNQIIVSVILVVILVLSTVGYALFSRDETSGSGMITKVTYNALDFILQSNDYWLFTNQGKNFLTAFNPQHTENISGKVSGINDYLNKPVYFEEWSDIQGVSEISRNLGQLFSRVQYACLTNCSSNNPVKNCSDIVISIKLGESLIKQNNKCVYITAPSQEILRTSDAFIFKVLGIQS